MYYLLCIIIVCEADLYTIYLNVVRTYVRTAPLSGRCSKLPRAGVILSQIIPQGMWGPENVKFKIT